MPNFGENKFSAKGLFNSLNYKDKVSRCRRRNIALV